MMNINRLELLHLTTVQNTSATLKLQPPSSSTTLSACAVSRDWSDILCKTEYQVKLNSGI
jgi:hypothetical protein